jgi:acyl CoA:acetate/3-ketoacid CoA transferase alpha subunit
LEYALPADFALVRAHKGDRIGNLVYRLARRNFNPSMAMAARITIAEVGELVDAGGLDPDAIHTPGLFVQRMAVRSA